MIDQIKAVIQQVLEQEFKGAQIDSIEIRETTDYEDDEVLFITVVFRAEGRLDSKATSGFVRHVRPKLHEIKEDRFPVMSFVSREDYRDELAETA